MKTSIYISFQHLTHWHNTKWDWKTFLNNTKNAMYHYSCKQQENHQTSFHGLGSRKKNVSPSYPPNALYNTLLCTGC